MEQVTKRRRYMARQTTHTPWSLASLLLSRLREWKARQQRQPMRHQDRAISELQTAQDEIGWGAIMFWKYLYPLEGYTGTILQGIGPTTLAPTLDHGSISINCKEVLQI
jgi:hypothetical protein